MGKAVTEAAAAEEVHVADRKRLTIVNVVGGRPNFVKIAPLMEAMAAVPTLRRVLVHTGQHYDHEISRVRRYEVSWHGRIV